MIHSLDIKNRETTVFQNYVVELATKIQYDPAGQQLLIFTNYGTLFALSKDGRHISILIGYIEMNDFEYSPALGVIFYTTDYAVKSCNLDGSNELTLFNSTVTKFERIALDLPAKRLFYTTTGMPETVKRIMSSKFDGSDKFRHYTIPIQNQQSPAIQIFENGIIITDSSKNSPIYHSKKVKLDFCTQNVVN